MDPPRLLDEHLHAFITHADFGPLYQRPLIGGKHVCVVGSRLQTYIPTITRHGIATNGVLQRLFRIYIYHHHLVDPHDVHHWRPNEELWDYLGAGLEQSTGRYPTLPTTYDLDFADLSQLTDTYTVPDNDLTPMERALVHDPVLGADLIAEQQLLSQSLYCIQYRNM